jgi:hypothetical protein
MSKVSFNGPLAPENNVALTTLNADATLGYNSPTYQLIDCGGGARDIHLPAITPAMAGRRFFIKNASNAAETITVDVVTPAGVQIVDGLVTGASNVNGTDVAITQNQCGWFIATGSTTTGQWCQIGVGAWDNTTAPN